MVMKIHVDIVSQEKGIYSGSVAYVRVSGIMGNMGIQYGHAPLLTKLKPGAVKVVEGSGSKEYFYISGGMLEIQPNCVTILADMAERADDLDEQALLRAQQRAQDLISNASEDVSKVQTELARAVAQLKVIQELRNKDV